MENSRKRNNIEIEKFFRETRKKEISTDIEIKEKKTQIHKHTQNKKELSQRKDTCKGCKHTHQK